MRSIERSLSTSKSLLRPRVRLTVVFLRSSTSRRARSGTWQRPQSRRLPRPDRHPRSRHVQPHTPTQCQGPIIVSGAFTHARVFSTVFFWAANLHHTRHSKSAIHPSVDLQAGSQSFWDTRSQLARRSRSTHLVSPTIPLLASTTLTRHRSMLSSRLPTLRRRTARIFTGERPWSGLTSRLSRRTAVSPSLPSSSTPLRPAPSQKSASECCLCGPMHACLL
jgi:hypothetical protein